MVNKRYNLNSFQDTSLNKIIVLFFFIAVEIDFLFHFIEEFVYKVKILVLKKFLRNDLFIEVFLLGSLKVLRRLIELEFIDVRN